MMRKQVVKTLLLLLQLDSMFMMAVAYFYDDITHFFGVAVKDVCVCVCERERESEKERERERRWTNLFLFFLIHFKWRGGIGEPSLHLQFITPHFSLLFLI